MKMTKKEVAQKANVEPDFLVGLLDNPRRTLKSFNIEVSESDMKVINAAMSECKDLVFKKVAELGAVETAKEIKGIGLGCCNV